MTTFMTDTLLFLGGLGNLVKQAVREIFRKPYPWSLTIEQIYIIGYKTFPLILITSLATGMVMTLQFGLGVQRFGGTLYVPKMITIAILREMGPMFTALMVAAKVSAGIASEIGSMVVTQQIDAIRALGTSPIKKIVIPRIVACLIALPLLVAFANILGFTGGLIVGVSELKLAPSLYLMKSLDQLAPIDYLAGFAKSFFFAVFITVPACYYGLTVKEGTKGVGIATTNAVVTSSIFIFVGDYFLTKFFWLLEKWMYS